ncbi:hypothetical protein [Paraburkholderia franconis]|uniref:hypothetical protein n=1 Tax=Paraburkholderia franconis TaxID=2654983 RepID=UPI00187BA395|nr:hypothetical protein [Paraburkholderia franconis]
MVRPSWGTMKRTICAGQAGEETGPNATGAKSVENTTFSPVVPTVPVGKSGQLFVRHCF